MTIVHTILRAAHAKGTHHYLALDALDESRARIKARRISRTLYPDWLRDDWRRSR